MFIHSVRVARLYKIAANITRDVKEKGGSIKALVFQGKHPNTQALYALVLETLQHGSEIDFLLSQSSLLVKEERLNPWLARVLITELLWGKKRLSGESKPVQTILKYQDVLNSYLSSIPPRLKYDESKKVAKPRYVRVNTLHLDTNDAIRGFQDEGWTLLPNNFTNYDQFLEAAKTLENYNFMTDLHIKELLLFPHKTEFHRHECYHNGSIVLQDKASCLPIHLLNPERGSTILDMCAAPGMKATQLAAKLHNDCTIYAVENDPKRHETLCELIENLGATSVKPMQADALTVTEDECPHVKYILLDPSCSGSGMEYFELESSASMNRARVDKLHNFQVGLLRHALLDFKANRVVYSTCSVYPEENELVIREVFNSCPPYRLANVRNLLGNHWKSFADKQYNYELGIGDRCIYARPHTDLTNGFFVAVFERTDNGSTYGEQVWEIGTDLENTFGDVIGAPKKIKKEERVFDDGQLRKKIKKENKLENQNAGNHISEPNLQDEFGTDESFEEKQKKKLAKKMKKEKAFGGVQEACSDGGNVDENLKSKRKRHRKKRELQEDGEEEEVNKDYAEHEADLPKKKNKKKKE